MEWNKIENYNLLLGLNAEKLLPTIFVQLCLLVRSSTNYTPYRRQDNVLRQHLNSFQINFLIGFFFKLKYRERQMNCF